MWCRRWAGWWLPPWRIPSRLTPPTRTRSATGSSMLSLLYFRPCLCSSRRCIGSQAGAQVYSLFCCFCASFSLTTPCTVTNHAERNQDLKLRQRWKAQGPCSFLGELGFWAELLDCLGSVLYMIGSFVLIFNFFTLIAALPIGRLAGQLLAPVAPDLSAPVFDGSPFSNETDNAPQLMETEFDASFTSTDALACKIFFFGDLTYALDAILYIILWKRYHKSTIDTADIDLGMSPGESYFPLEDNLERLAVPLKEK